MAISLEGYDRLAAFIAPDKGLSIFRRFARLNVKNLLYFQAEIVNLDDELKDIIEEDKDPSNPERKAFPFSVWHLKDSLDQQSTQWKKFMEIRGLLNEYNNALIQYAQLLRFSPPHRHDLEIFNQWLRQKEGGNFFFATGLEMDQWTGKEGENEKDLIALMGRYEEVDCATRWIYRVVVPYFHRFWGHRRKAPDLETGAWYYDDGRIIAITNVISTMVSAILPASSILVLHFMENMIAKIVIIVLYNMVFALVLGFMVRARRIEIFATAMAFAAVQVAFITNAPSCGGGS